MQHRSVGKFIAFSILTLGIYTLVWFFWTTKELKALGADVPTPWLLFIPIAGFYFLWKYFEAAEQMTQGAVNGVLYFMLGFFISPIVSASLAQNEYNKLAPAAPAAGMPAAPGMPQQPAQPVAPAAPADPSAPQDPNQQPPVPPAPAA